MGLREEKPVEELVPQKLTFEEYIKIEQENNQKYEYHDGFIVAMSGGTLNHSRIGGNIHGKIWSLLDSDSKKCEVFSSDTKLAIEVENKYLYPDVMIICGEVKESEHQNHAVTNPKVIVEVVSKSTGKYDKSGKFGLYRQIESLEYYVLVEQDKPQVEVHRKMNTEQNPEISKANKKQGNTISLWQIETIIGMDNNLSFPTLDIQIPFSAIYKNIKFDKE